MTVSIPPRQALRQAYRKRLAEENKSLLERLNAMFDQTDEKVGNDPDEPKPNGSNGHNGRHQP